MDKPTSLIKKAKDVVIGQARNLYDVNIFHSLSLIAFFAWVGLGADGLSSSCYGPAEAYITLKSHTPLALIVGLATVVTIFIISTSYSQIIELFPSGGGGYLVASKLLSPGAGMVAGCALLIDYILTITVSVASGSDAIFSLLPLEWQGMKMSFAIFILILLTIMNLRGVKDSIVPLVPIFILFLVTHAFIIIYGLTVHITDFPAVAASFKADSAATINQLGFMGALLLILKSYSMGAGTYTGIEAVSNGVSILREPRVKTAKATMRYMSVSLAVVVMGLMLTYLLFNVHPVEGKTLNAVLLERATFGWPASTVSIFIFATLFAEAALLFVAAQTGFLGGPKVLANMAHDRWFPSRFSAMSDRLVTQNGILIMGMGALAIMLLSGGSVQLLVVLYSINVFITFVLSQLGMVRHWWNERRKRHSWKRKIFVNGTGLILCLFILISMVVIKFNDGGWVTLTVTGALILMSLGTRKHYKNTAVLLRRLNALVVAVEQEMKLPAPSLTPAFDPKGKTAIVFVSGYNGMGLHTLMNIVRFFGNTFRNFVFIQVGLIDSGNFKGVEEIDRLETKCSTDVERYAAYMRRQGCYAEGLWAVGVDVIEESEKLALEAAKRFPSPVFFGGQLVFPNDSLTNRLFHNYTVFSLQKTLYKHGLLFVILPIKV
ncbi:MAG: APC family permease [Candidatus Omnitrophica bacterium]|nr:APC family permease [Candidatus Omnitrophota bacterium]